MELESLQLLYFLAVSFLDTLFKQLAAIMGLAGQQIMNMILNPSSCDTTEFLSRYVHLF